MPKLGTRVYDKTWLISGHTCDDEPSADFLPFDNLEPFPLGSLVDHTRLRAEFAKFYPGEAQQLQPKKQAKTMTELSRDSRAKAKAEGKPRHDTTTRAAALTRLSKLFPVEFEALINDERAKVGLGPIRRRMRNLPAEVVEMPEPPKDMAEAKVIARIVEQTPGKCAHPTELRIKEPFGTFCGHCGVRI